jgi:hypothetical protein
LRHVAADGDQPLDAGGDGVVDDGGGDRRVLGQVAVVVCPADGAGP